MSPLKAAAIAGLLMTAAGAAAAQTVTILPQRPYLEPGGAGTSANFDILVRNDGNTPMEVSSLSVTIADASGREVLERRVDGNGVAPSVKTLALAPLKPGEARLVFNPFPVIPADIAAKAVRVEVELSPHDRKGAAVRGAAKAEFRAPPALALMLPLAGKVWVWDGHDLLAHHRRWDYSNPDIAGFGFSSNAMRYSYDLVRVDGEGRRVIGDAARNENHLSFGLPVRAPAAGTVVEIENGQTDDGKFDPATFRDHPNLMLGNHVVIRHGEGLFSILGHLKQGSVTVKAGDVVKAGQTVAAVGNSGTSMFPHLHYQLMNGPTFASEGVPSAFTGLTRLRGDARAPLPGGAIDSGDVVESRN
ncbi:MAG: M23 family metallopeptidase [Alphaproteobacteria bacterium]|nr:M23 family metallopeptidase [Alphaproteobacteria bacterium]